ncbi:3-deoxy-7-phosphoheptulonate synthase [Anaeropeptidivorans aminofermentans]|jgi:3-deoxy-7-phosphoheptulonate synthase|uniref:3-deoxy-7-phosphoheptulonate synthase n=1 Tax=Anaeropeptidivorans aminofermentans TaxID=2934315 RepID=UPI002023D1DC|nr:3-deoxy-7-phosphoheptulonate synthase [Anaeropeptidivorans aminofermentans]MBE6012725.1 3-deoxy-7-phosphoheptulonate synthase [Lachnospiraceae bacterium]
MIIILKPKANEEKVRDLIKRLERMELSINYSEGATTTVIGLIGDTSAIDMEILRAHEIVADVKRITEPYKAANRKFHPDDTIIEVAGHKIGQGYFNVFAGPCSVESEEQIIAVAEAVKKSGAGFLRGGAFKPRTSPYSFQGLKEDGLKLLLKAKKATGMPIITEIMSELHLALFEDVDLIQVGARNMQNFTLLKELGRTRKPIFLKRGLSSTMEEFFMSAEYIMAEGNRNVILCERGIRTFEPSIRNNLDISAIPIVKRFSHLPIVIDPSHAAGTAWMVEPLSKAAIAAGADGLMIEVHNNPKEALSDGAQSLDFDEFSHVMEIIKERIAFEGKVMG